MILNCPSENNLVYNNTLISSNISISDWSNDGEQNMTGTVLENNIYTAYTVYTQAGKYYTASNNLADTTNPQFADPTLLDFQLQSGSPAINAGMVIPAITNGYVGLGAGHRLL